MTTTTTGINQRIRELRLAEGLNQKEFGQRLGVVQATISRFEQPNIDISEANINLICKTFHINPDWLRTGLGNRYLSSGGQGSEKQDEKEHAFAAFAAAYNLSKEQTAAIRMILTLSPDELGFMTQNLLHCAEAYRKAQETDAWERHRIEEHRRLDMELDAEKQGYSSASPESRENEQEKRA